MAAREAASAGTRQAARELGNCAGNTASRTVAASCVTGLPRFPRKTRRGADADGQPAAFFVANPDGGRGSAGAWPSSPHCQAPDATGTRGGRRKPVPWPRPRLARPRFRRVSSCSSRPSGSCPVPAAGLIGQSVVSSRALWHRQRRPGAPGRREKLSRSMLPTHATLAMHAMHAMHATLAPRASF
jgi:hypothetical protein